MNMKKITELKEHQLNIKIYGDEVPDTSLIESINKNGLLVPLTIKNDGTIISGHRRFKACKVANIEDIPVNIIEFDNELEEKETLIHFNQQREKNYSQKFNEAKELEIIESEKALKRKNKIIEVEKEIISSVPQMFAEGSKIIPNNLKAESKQVVAKKTGFGSKENLRKYEKIVEANKSELIEKLDKGEITINRAYNEIKKAENKKKLEEMKKPIKNINIKSDIKILNVDCFEMLKTLENNSVDSIITDPPYFVTENEWDIFKSEEEFLLFLEKLLIEFKRVLKKESHLFLFMDSRWMAKLESIFLKVGFKISSRIVWVRKNMSMGRVVKDKFISQWEICLHSGTKILNFPLEWGNERGDVQEFAVPQSNFNDKKLHPTQKPLEFIKRLVDLSSNIGNLVVDPFCGSGTTAKACDELNRKCITSDLNTDYVNIAKNRIFGGYYE